MKKLFLTSHAVYTLPLLNQLTTKDPKNSTVAFIATAADPYKNKEFVDVDRQAMQNLGYTIKEIDLKECQHERLEDALSNVDIIFVAGGNTYYLLDWAKKSGFYSLVKKLVERGIIYIGSSAGSVVCCPTIDIARRFDPPEAAPDLTDYKGFDLVDFLLLPHVQKEKYRDRIKQTVLEWEDKGYLVKQLTDAQVIIVEGETVRTEAIIA
jgi:dipeptidase E